MYLTLSSHILINTSSVIENKYIYYIISISIDVGQSIYLHHI